MPQIMDPKEQTKKTAVNRVAISKILVTTDFSEVSDRALEYALALGAPL